MRKVKEKKEHVGRNNHLLNRRDVKKDLAIFP